MTFTAFAAVNYELKPSDYKDFPNTLKGHDFFTKRSATPSLSQKRGAMSLRTHGEPTENCREYIAKVICLVNPVEGDVDVEPEQRECLPGGEAYAIHFERLYDNYPPLLQQMFCSLRYLFIEKQFFGTAYAGTLHDKDGNADGAIMGIRQSVLDQNLNLTQWATWKEQLSFGGITDSYAWTPGLQTIATASLPIVNDFLYFVVTHEFGHIFDFANDLNRTTEECESIGDPADDKECVLAAGTWGSISWATDTRPKAQNEFVNRSGLCFYGCDNGHLQQSDIPQVYADMAKTDFISLYTTQQPWDDFADSLAYFVMSRNLGTTYVIDTHQGQTYNIIEKLHSPLFAEKYNYIDNFLKRTDLVYP